MTVLKQIGPLLLMGAALVTACAKDNSEYPQPAASQGAEATPEPPMAVDNSSTVSQLSDSEILGIMATVDAGEIEQARLALSKASDSRVKKYAMHMIEQHTEATQQVASTASQHGMTPAASSTSSTLQIKGNKVLDDLNNASSAAFDSTYMRAQIQQHQEVLDMLHAQLMPASRSDVVSAQLKAVHTMVQGHLNEARQLEPLLDTASRVDPAQPSKTMPLPQQ